VSPGVSFLAGEGAAHGGRVGAEAQVLDERERGVGDEQAERDELPGGEAALAVAHAVDAGAQQQAGRAGQALGERLGRGEDVDLHRADRGGVGDDGRERGDQRGGLVGLHAAGRAAQAGAVGLVVGVAAGRRGPGR
jgi:hypothetical protein